MFTKNTSSKERLSIWREFRQNFPENGTQELVATQFKDIQLESRYIDYYTPNSWPNTFEIVSEGYFCQSGVTLVLAATLHYLKFINEERITLEVISNHITGQDGLVLNLDGSFFNFLAGEVSDEKFVRDNSTSFDKYIIAVDKLYA